MKFTLNWLKTHLQTEAPLAQISETLTAIGLEVEEISNPAESLADFTVALIESTEKHPDADRLKICQVKTGSGEMLQIVCGAPNARAGIKVALARVGALIPNGDFKIKKSKIRGVESSGMLCSSRELNLGDDHDGIMELPASAEIGAPIAEALGLNDPVIEIALTPNRGDCLGVRGIARDLAAAGLGTLKQSTINHQPSTISTSISVALNHPACPQFTYALISGVTNGQSPGWMQQRLKAVGQRPISALVDITNYVSIDQCRPLHVYDADKLRGNITVRAGKAGESFAALNDKTYTLQGGEVAICDDSGVIGLGGIMGGNSTACDENTQNVLLEVAWFDPIIIAQTGRTLAIESDARYRFERSVDPLGLEAGAQQALALISECCGGKASEIRTSGNASDYQPHRIAFDAAAINRLLGLKIDAAQQLATLTALGFTQEGSHLIPPSWRNDVEGMADLAEEIGRIHGYDALLPAWLEKPAKRVESRDERSQREWAAKQALAVLGMQETVHWSFCAAEDAARFGGAPEALKLINPISSELNQMRPSLLPHLLRSLAQNAARGHKLGKMFEVGLQFSGLGENGQQAIAAGAFATDYTGKTLYHPARISDIYDAKAAIEAAINACGFDAARLQQHPMAANWYHPGKSITYKLGKTIIAQGGEIHPRIAKEMDISEGMVGFEIYLSTIPATKKKTAARAPLALSDYQAVERDFSFIAAESFEAGRLVKLAQKEDTALIRHACLFDIYRGKGLGESEKSLALRITLQADDRTLTDAEIDVIGQKLVANAEKIGLKLRA